MFIRENNIYADDLLLKRLDHTFSSVKKDDKDDNGDN